MMVVFFVNTVRCRKRDYIFYSFVIQLKSEFELHIFLNFLIYVSLWKMIFNSGSWYGSKVTLLLFLR